MNRRQRRRAARRAQPPPEHRPAVTEILHAGFVAGLGDRLLVRYTDGGPTDRNRAARRARGKAQRAARRRNRQAAR